MKNFLKQFPASFYLIPLYPVIYLINYNFSKIYIANTFRSITICILFSSILTLSFYLISKPRSRRRFALLVYMFLFVFFTYGIQYEFAEKLFYSGWWPFKNIHRWLSLLNGVVLGLLLWQVRKNQILYESFNYKINVFFTLLMILNLLGIVNKLIGMGNSNEEKISILQSNSNDPDIFYILLDGYASDDVLKNYYRYNNDPFKTELKILGFKDYSGVITYYYSTQYALNAVFNLNFIDRDTLKNYSLQDNIWFRYLLSRGYALKYVESGYHVTTFFSHAQKIYVGGLKEFERMLLRFTLIRFDELFGGMAYHRLMRQINQIEQFESLLTPGPDFVFFHIVCPHPPFVLDKNVKKKTKFVNKENFWEPASDFADQTHALNQLILPPLKKLTRQKNTLIILQSDHGPWFSHKNPDTILKIRESILTAIRWPDQNPVDSISHSINTFRCVIRKYFDSSFALLPHREKNIESFRKNVLVRNLLDE